MPKVIRKFYRNGVEYKIRFPVPPYLGLCFTANTAGSTVVLIKYQSAASVNLETSIDGRTWSDYSMGTTITLANVGDKVRFRNKSETPTGFSTGDSSYYSFGMSGSISASGDVTYLLCKNGTNTVSDYGFNKLFYQCTSLTTAPDFPATTVGNYSYQNAFYGCTNLTAAPALPATTLKAYCYYQMCYGCSNLTSLGHISATTLDTSCCNSMFERCTNLEVLPSLAATSLKNSCYYRMFANCPKIKVSATQTGAYQTAYRIPTSGTGSTATNAVGYFLLNTGGTLTGTPSINTTYYTSNTVV